MTDYEYYYMKTKAQMDVLKELINGGYDGLTINNVADRLKNKADHYAKRIKELNGKEGEIPCRQH